MRGRRRILRNVGEVHGVGRLRVLRGGSILRAIQGLLFRRFGQLRRLRCSPSVSLKFLLMENQFQAQMRRGEGDL